MNIPRIWGPETRLPDFGQAVSGVIIISFLACLLALLISKMIRKSSKQVYKVFLYFILGIILLTLFYGAFFTYMVYSLTH